MFDESEIKLDSEEVKLNFLQKWYYLYYEPENTFKAIKTKSDWFIPLLILTVIGVISAVLITPYILPEILEEAEENIIRAMERSGSEMSSQTMESTLENIAKWVQYGSPVQAAIGVWFIALLITLVLWIVQKLLKGEATFGNIFSLSAYTMLAISIIGTIIKVPLIILKETMQVHTSPLIFFPDLAKEDLIYIILSQLDIFVLVQVFLLGYGLSYLAKWKSMKGILTVFVCWLIFATLISVVTALQVAKMGA